LADTRSKSSSFGLVYLQSHVFWGEYGTIPVDPSDDAGDEGGISGYVSLNTQATDPKSHTLVESLLLDSQRYRYLLNSDGRPYVEH